MYKLMMSDSIIGLFIRVVPVSFLVAVIYAVFRYMYIKKHRISVTWGTEIVRCLFVCYLTGLINLILTPSNLWTAIWFYIFNGYSGCSVGTLFEFNFNFIPSIYRCIVGELMLGSWVKTMLAGNILMFVPMGIFLPFVFKRIKGRNIVPIAIAIPIIIELIQPIVGRSFDIDDILTNFIGIILGYFISVVLRAFIMRVHKNKKQQ